MIIDPTTNAATSVDVRLYDTGNYGSDTRLAVGKFPNASQYKSRTLINFNLSGIPSNATVLRTTMNLKYYEAINFGGGTWVDRWVQAHQLLVSWNEAQATKDNRLTGTAWNATYGKIGGAVPPADDANGQFESTTLFWQSELSQLPVWKSWDLAALTQEWLATPTSNYGVILWATNENTDGYTFRFHSSEASNSSDRPYLEVVYSTEAATSTVYFLKDHLGSIRATVLDSAGALVIGYDDYDPWGYPLVLRTKAIPNAYLQGASKHKFTGKERDEEFGLNLDYFGARYYDGQIGRWMARDPFAEKYPSWSPYHYALDNPIRFYDIDGRDIRNASTRPVVVIGDTKNPAQPAYVVLGPSERTEGLEGDFDFYRFADDIDATWYKVSISKVIDVDVTETGEPKVTNLLGKILKELPNIHVKKATPEEAEAASIIQREVEEKKRKEEEKRMEEEKRKEEERKRQEEEKRKQEEQRKENERQ